MPGSRKAADVQRDPRIAVQALSDDPPENDQALWRGDAKLAGAVVGLAGPRFGIDIRKVVLTHLNEAADMLVVDSWHPDRGFETPSRP